VVAGTGIFPIVLLPISRYINKVSLYTYFHDLRCREAIGQKLVKSSSKTIKKDFKTGLYQFTNEIKELVKN
jgi:hypothetical protein